MRAFWWFLAALLFVATGGPGTARAQGPDGVPEEVPDNFLDDEPKLKTFRIGIIVDGQRADLTALRDGVQAEVKKLLMHDAVVTFPPAVQLDGNFSKAQIGKHLDTLLANPEVELIVTLGVVGSYVASQRKNLTKPVVAPFVLGPRLRADDQKKAFKRINLSHIVWALDLQRDLDAFRELGDFERMAFIGDSYLYKELPHLESRVKTRFKQLGVEVTIVRGDDVDKTLAAIPTTVDSVFVGGLAYSDADYRKLANTLAQRRLPSFSFSGQRGVRLGLLAGLADSQEGERFVRRVSLNIHAIALGDPPSDLVSAFRRNEQLSLNVATARTIGLWPDWSVLTDAILIGDKKKKVSRRLSLRKVVEESMARNLDVAAAKQVVLAGEAQVNLARAELLPQLDASASGLLLDADRAGPTNAEQTLQWSAKLQQLIFSDRAWGAFTSQGHLQVARKHDREALRMDVAQQTAETYLKLLAALTSERLQRDNLGLVRANLAQSRVRKKIGTGKPGEVYRWQAEIANQRRRVIMASATRNQLEIAVNQLLNRPLEESFVTREASLEDDSLLSGHKGFAKYLRNPRRFKVLRAFLAKEAIANAPELKSLNANIAAQQRQVDTNKRQYFVPTIAAQAGVTHRFLLGGNGSTPTDTSTLPPELAGAFPSPDRFDLSAGLTISLPLYNGGSRYATTRKSEVELAQLKVKKRNAALSIEARVRSALHVAGASYAAIALSEKAHKASEGNLKVVTDSYGAGTASIITVLDAQNQRLQAALDAANAKYQFMVDLMVVERAMGRLVLLSTPESSKAMFARLSRFDARQRLRATNAGAK